MERRHHPVLKVEDARAGGLHAVLHLEQELVAAAGGGGVRGQAAGLSFVFFGGAGRSGRGVGGGGSFSSTEDRPSTYYPRSPTTSPSGRSCCRRSSVALLAPRPWCSGPTPLGRWTRPSPDPPAVSAPVVCVEEFVGGPILWLLSETAGWIVGGYDYRRPSSVARRLRIHAHHPRLNFVRNKNTAYLAARLVLGAAAAHRTHPHTLL